MQREAIRATVSGAKTDVPMGVFTLGQPLVYDAATSTIKTDPAGGTSGLANMLKIASLRA